MLRRAVFSAGALALSAAVVVVGAGLPAGASGPPPAHGTVLCGISSGSGTLAPGLTPAGSAGGVKITFAAKFSTGNCASNVTTPPGVVVVGGSLTGSGFYNAPASSGIGSSCAAFDGPDTVGKIVVKIKWMTTGGPIANTKVIYQNNPGTVSGSPTDTITLKAPPGTAVKQGSFHAPPMPNLTQLTTNIPAPPCGPGPFTTFTISGGSVQM
jgi:hypothetical protein